MVNRIVVLVSESNSLADSAIPGMLEYKRGHRDILNRDSVGLEQRDVVGLRPPRNLAGDNLADLIDAVPGDQTASHRLHEVASLLLRLLNRVRRHEGASTDRDVIEFAGLEAVRSDGIDVASGTQPISMDDRLRRIRRGDGHVRVSDRLFSR